MTTPTSPMPRVGELAPDFTVFSDVNPQFQFTAMGGTWIVLLFQGSLGVPMSAAAHQALAAAAARFDPTDVHFFNVSIDPADRDQRGLKSEPGGVRCFFDFDVALSRLYGVAGPGTYAPTVFLLDRWKRVAAVEPASRIERLLERLGGELEADRPWRSQAYAPVLTLPGIFEPEFCAELIAHYESVGGVATGFMNQVGGRTVAVSNQGMKRRKDATIADPALREAARDRIYRRLIPALERFMGWRATRIERFIVACYSEADAGFFRAHRDNTTLGTAHRKFAVTLNLNAEDYEGGELRFPEFGSRTYKPPTGGVTVFGCGLLHEATPVTRGQRYAFLPFLYDEEGRRIRDANMSSVGPEPEADAADAASEA